MIRLIIKFLYLARYHWLYCQFFNEVTWVRDPATRTRLCADYWTLCEKHARRGALFATALACRRLRHISGGRHRRWRTWCSYWDRMRTYRTMPRWELVGKIRWEYDYRCGVAHQIVPSRGLL